MQIAETTPGTSIEVVGPSLVLDLSWCIHALTSPHLRTTHPVLGQLWDDNAELGDRTLSFWSDGFDCFAEAEILAHHAGCLGATDFPTFRAGAEAAAGTIPLDLGLGSETVEDRAIILSRLGALQGSAALRRRYFDLLAEIWSLLGPWWGNEGVAAAERAAADVRTSLARGVPWHEVVTSDCETFIRHMPEIIEHSEAGHPVVLAACALFGRGLYLELPGCTLVGFGVGGPVQEARARTSVIVPPLRALADPTRLAIFDYLKSGPVAMRDIAQAFSLSQPTVSVHIKRLREAGLVTAERRGNRLEIAVDPTTAGALATELAALLSG
jgi:ArsR family transcriptional regulator, arsenate/arsenite/antimonite-responsive transcriptional repressor